MPVKKSDLWKLDKNMKLKGNSLKGIKWLDPKERPFVVSGFGWFEKEKIFRRLPVKPQWKVADAVNSLANCTSGAQIRFQTNSKRVAIRVLLSGVAGMHHMPATGVGGFDCYIGAPGKKKYLGTTVFHHAKDSYEYLFFTINKRDTKNITLNFPLYMGVKAVLVGVDTGSKVLPPLPYKNDKKVIIYGTSITQGGCASRPGMAFTNILSRRFNYEFINLGFSGNGRGEPELAKLILEIDNPGCFILDYEANCGSFEQFEKSLPEFISILRSKYAKIPILVITKVRYATESISDSLSKRLTRLKFQKKLIACLKKKGDKNISLLDASNLLGKDFHECSVDGGHPTDLGFMRMANGIEPVLRKILGKLWIR